MASKDKRNKLPIQSDAPVSPRQEVDRLIARGKLKDAVKQAKICRRDHPSPEHHRLLERVTLLRAQELQQGGMVMAAREVATHLLDLPLTDPELIEPVVGLLLAIGMAGEAIKLQGRLDSPEAVDRLNRRAADLAVTHPERTAGVTSEVITWAQRVRSALETIINGGGVEALDLLREIPRSSPFADWRWFARGLVASRRGNDAEAQASWDRLAPDRVAARIARTLGAVIASVSGTTPSTDPVITAARDRLERWAFGEPLIGPLQGMAQAMVGGDWEAVLSKAGLVSLNLHRFDPALAVRLTQALIDPLAGRATKLGYDEGRRLIQRFVKAVPPLPIDPRGYRFWALIWEGPQGSIEDAEPFWRKYLDDLNTVSAIRPEDREMVRGLIFTHLGEAYAEYLPEANPDGSVPKGNKAEVEGDRRLAISHLETSLKHLPTYRPTYQELMDIHQNAGKPDQAAEVARRLLAVLPDDYETLIYLTGFHFQRDEPALGLDYAVRARRIKPLDRSATHWEWACHVAQACQQALARKWDVARTHLETAARINPETSASAHFAARRVILEIKAKKTVRADELIDETLARLPEAASFRLGMAIEARRYKLPKLEIAKAEALWATEAAKKVRGDSAGALAALMSGFYDNKVTYVGLKTHVQQVMGYIRRTSRTKYTRVELSHVCDFLTRADGGVTLCKTMATRGLKSFPEAPEFPLILGSLELEKGRYGANISSAKSYLTRALKLALAEERTNPKAAAMLPEVKKVLAAIDQLQRGPTGFPFSFGGGFGGGQDNTASIFAAMGMDGYDDDVDEEDYDDEDEFESLPPPPPPPRPKRRKL